MSDGTVRIESFRPELRQHFYDLNVAWLRELFRVEPIDELILGNPEREVIESGGEVLFALLAGEVVGTCALKHHGDGVYELTKMAVQPALRKRGIGELLIAAMIDVFRARAGRQLFLESHSSLEGALRLYTRMGFVRQAQLRPGSKYVRSDVYMIFGA